MTQHTLAGRTEDEVLWFQRRSFLQAASAWTAMGGFAAAQAQERSNVVQFVGDVLVNGARLLSGQAIQTGDHIQTGPQASLIFVIGNASFKVRQNSNMVAERGSSINVVSLLRLVTGAVVSVWGKGFSRQIITPTLTAGIRGTGVYTEVFNQQDNRSYFCNCYGTVDIADGTDSLVSVSSYHQSFWGEAQPKGNRYLLAAQAINHTDEELEYLAALVNQKTAWQILGRKGVKDGRGFMDKKPGEMNPADMLGK